ncbi:Xaa-Pro peptidase family protein [Rheinheimera texasensis]|uniref:M24 family metallopeptidase n=1 Tax=Rheinheimera texasensis TaxID=306205 RepID=UPI0032B17E38
MSQLSIPKAARQIGGADPAQVLASLTDMREGVSPIALPEYQARMQRACALMREQNIAALYLNAGSSLLYFTGTAWYASERLVGAILTADGVLKYIAPVFEIGTLSEYQQIKAEVIGWEEDENPYQLLLATLGNLGVAADARVGLDESCAFFIVDALQQLAPTTQFINAAAVTAACRRQKSAAEIAIMQRAMDMTLTVHQAVAQILKPGISTLEVEAFIDEAHRRVGASGSYFCIVLFGEATAYPHGVKDPQYLQRGDMVLIDTGCRLHHYVSDITRSYVFGEPTERQQAIWNLEKQAQAAAFAAAQPGVPCGAVDDAARAVLTAAGLGPDYRLPGLPHRTGHGIGLDIHEWPYLVRGNVLPLAEGMCFSNEPMICIPGEFGVRLEDHFYMTQTGPRWFTEPAFSITDPFGWQQA